MLKAQSSISILPKCIGKALFLTISWILIFTQNSNGAVESGALLTGTVLSDNNSTVANTAKAIKWSFSDLDPGTFDFNSSLPTRLKVKSAGNYFFAFTGPIVEQIRTASNRSQVEFVIRKNGTAVPEASTRCTYCLLYTSPSPRDLSTSRMPSSA